MLIFHKGHTDTIQVYSVTVMTHVKALQAGHSSQGTSEPITPGHYGLLLMRINTTTLMHGTHELVRKYIMEKCDVDLCYNLYAQIRFIELSPCRKCALSNNVRRRIGSTRRRTSATGSLPPQ